MKDVGDDDDIDLIIMIMMMMMMYNDDRMMRITKDVGKQRGW